jgi:hypothetical protein
VRKYEEVTYEFKSNLRRPFIRARKKKDNPEMEVILPILATQMTSFAELETLQNAFDANSITLSICDCNSLVMYYKVTKS